jgi:hypothetical protein
MELAVWVKAVCVRPKMIAIARVTSQGVEYLMAMDLSFLLNLEPGVCECREGSFDMFSPEDQFLEPGEPTERWAVVALPLSLRREARQRRLPESS